MGYGRAIGLGRFASMEAAVEYAFNAPGPSPRAVELDRHDAGDFLRVGVRHRVHRSPQLLDRRLGARAIAELHRRVAEREELVDVLERALSLHRAPVATLDEKPRPHRGELAL